MVVGEVEDENIVIPISLWETQDDWSASRPDFAAFRDTFDFSIQEGPTRAGTAIVVEGQPFSAIKVRPVVPPPPNPSMERGSLKSALGGQIVEGNHGRGQKG